MAQQAQFAEWLAFTRRDFPAALLEQLILLYAFDKTIGRKSVAQVPAYQFTPLPAMRVTTTGIKLREFFDFANMRPDLVFCEGPPAGLPAPSFSPALLHMDARALRTTMHPASSWNRSPPYWSPRVMPERRVLTSPRTRSERM